MYVNHIYNPWYCVCSFTLCCVDMSSIVVLSETNREISGWVFFKKH